MPGVTDNERLRNGQPFMSCSISLILDSVGLLILARKSCSLSHHAFFIRTYLFAFITFGIDWPFSTSCIGRRNISRSESFLRVGLTETRRTRRAVCLRTNIVDTKLGRLAGARYCRSLRHLCIHLNCTRLQ